MPTTMLPLFLLSRFVFSLAPLKLCLGYGQNLPHCFAEVIRRFLAFGVFIHRHLISFRPILSESNFSECIVCCDLYSKRGVRSGCALTYRAKKVVALGFQGGMAL